MKNLPIAEILSNRKILKKNFYEKRGLKNRAYARKYQLCQTALTNILSGKTTLMGEKFNDNSPAKKVVEQLWRDFLWVGPIPYGMNNFNPLQNFHRGLKLGAFTPDGNLVISNMLINHLKIHDLNHYHEVALIATIDALSADSGFCDKTDSEIASITGLKREDITSSIQKLWLNSWFKIEINQEKQKRKITPIKPFSSNRSK